MDVGNRIVLFIDSCYGGKHTVFAETIGILIQSLSRYTTGKSYPGIDLMKKFYEAGMCIDWLITGLGSMYANNEVGRDLKLMNSKPKRNDVSTPISRLKLWIELHFASLDDFAAAIDIDFDKIYDMLFGFSNIDLEVIQKLRDNGCNTDWLYTGEGSMYSNNPTGFFLQLKNKDYSLDENLESFLNKLKN